MATLRHNLGVSYGVSSGRMVGAFLWDQVAGLGYMWYT